MQAGVGGRGGAEGEIRENLKQAAHWVEPDMGLDLTTPTSWPALKSRVGRLNPLSHPGSPMVILSLTF